MKYIIGCLMIILAYSSYMALTTSGKQAVASILPNVNTETNEVNETPKAVEVPEPQVPVETKEDPPPQYDSDENVYEEPHVNPIVQEIADVFGNEYRLAIAVAMAESGLNPNAINYNRDGSRDIGIFQINEHHGWNQEDLFNWRANIAIAKELRDTIGWTAWSAFNNGTYRKYL